MMFLPQMPENTVMKLEDKPGFEINICRIIYI